MFFLWWWIQQGDRGTIIILTCKMFDAMSIHESQKILKENEQTVLILNLLYRTMDFFFCHLPINIQVLWIHWSFTNMNFKSLHISQMIWCVSAWKCCLIFNHWVKNLYLWPAIVIRLFFHFVNNVKFCNKIVMF